MERYKKGCSRNQIPLIPMCLEDLISEDAEVRALDIIIEKMDISALGFTHSKAKQTGRKAYDPGDMFKLYAYSYFNGIRSSRKIERECNRNIEIMRLIGGLKPDFKTIADFRKDNKEAIKAAFRRFSMICCELGLVSKELVAVDGSKFRASNSRFKYNSHKKIEEKIKHHTESAEKYMELLDIYDKEETKQPELTKEEILEKIEYINGRMHELSELKTEVLENGTIYETDSDSRMMKMNNNGCDICHNVQIAVDDNNHLVIAVDVTSQQVDKEQLYNMASQAKEIMNAETISVIADKGYYSAKQFKQCENAGIKPIVSKADHSNAAASEEYSKEKFEYNEEMDAYICPEGQVLRRRKSGNRSKYKDYPTYANQIACQKCDVHNKCTKGKNRNISDQPLQAYARIVDVRTKEKIHMYRRRKQLAEHPFGTVKRALGFTYFLTRGNANVKTESLLHFLIYNMKRMINILGMQGIKEALQG